LRAVLLVLPLIGIGLILRFARRSVSVALAVVLVLTLAVVDVAAAVNASYRYLPALGVALGLGGADDIRDAYADRARGRVPENGLVVSATLPGTRSGFAAREAIAYLPPAWFGFRGQCSSSSPPGPPARSGRSPGSARAACAPSC
jgi:hypothetical protein